MLKGERKKVFVGVSGGVDSSVSAALLKEKGYDVTGVFIRTWQPDWLPCTWRDERRDAMRVCARLNIPFRELDLEDEYKQHVADYMIQEYREGRTPNPDVMCNKEIKFGRFLEWALSEGADYIATGHYAQVRKESEKHQLIKGIDHNKDQSYFLWTLTQQQLRHTLFPIGHLEKSEVRELAEKFGLFTAIKKDSQGICFLGKVDMKEFLKHYIQVKSGNVLNRDGEIIGTHEGALFYTLGERHGFTITKKGTNDQPYYVIAKDIDQNTITVAHNMETLSERSGRYMLRSTNNISGDLQVGKIYQAHIRYHGSDKSCVIIEVGDETMAIELEQDDSTVTPGQSLVLYEGEQCVGGGIVE